MERAVLDAALIHVPDVRQEAEHHQAVAEAAGVRALLAAPLLRDGRPIGAIGVGRSHPGAFTDKQIALLETFADQAVIAIENVRLFKELEARNRDLTESLEQQTATGEVLRVIASSPTELQPVLDTLIANAVKLSGATTGHIRQLDGDLLRYVAHFNESSEVIAALNQRPLKPGPDSISARALLAKTPVHVVDAQAERNYSGVRAQFHARTMLTVPLLREETGIGTILIWRDFVEPFTERQIELVKTFADQAVIAIENVRLFKELQERNRDLTEALEQQTATSEILRVISSSPTDLQPVIETILNNARRLCDAAACGFHRFDGEFLHYVTSVGTSENWQSAQARRDPFRPSRETATRLAALERRIVHVPDILNAPEFVDYQTGRHAREGQRSALAVPFLKEDTLLGVITVGHRIEPRPFTDSQIALVKTFADQAVIAIENVRLFKELQERNSELREALEHQTATSEVLGIISRSPTDVQPVLDAIVESAARVCGIDDVVLRLVEGNIRVPRAH